MANTTLGPYPVGTPVHVVFTFQNLALTYIDPTTITFKYTQPGLSQPRVTIVSPDARIVKDSVGNYHVDLDTTGWLSGTLPIRVESVGPLGVQDGTIVLSPSLLA